MTNNTGLLSTQKEKKISTNQIQECNTVSPNSFKHFSCREFNGWYQIHLLEVVDVTYHFDSAEQYNNEHKSQYKYKLCVAEHINCNTYLIYNKYGILIAILHKILIINMLGIPKIWK